MKKIILIFLFILTFTISAQDKPLRVLFIGNSYTAVNNLPQMVSDVATSAGEAFIFESNTPGGCTFQQHCSNTSMTLICKGGWDVVVLQEQSQIPSFPINQVQSICFPFAAQLVDSIYSINPCARAMFYMTWGRENGDSENCPHWPPVCTYEGMDSLLYERYMTMGEENQADVAPVGAVWHHIREYFPEIELYSGDGSHPSLSGSYAAACTFFSLIFQQDPTLITNNLNVPDEKAEVIKNAVKTVVYDSLSKWMKVESQTVTAQFDFLIQENKTVDFHNFSVNATEFEWDFGDGFYATSENPIHQYAGWGDYQVVLKASNICSVDTFSQIVTLSNVSLNEKQAAKIKIFPNPTNDQITLTEVNSYKLEVCNFEGKSVLQTIATANTFSLDLSSLITGVYVIKIWKKEKMIKMQKVIKR
ncbi:MAG: T9SS type A sorting domain-containing protein [Bacteroidales bacterium]|nr:T9SS type A sorting domain-containing protein [Bacteroidales bacterium]